MSKNVSYSKGEKYNSLSKKDGFRSRAAYKLIQIQKTFINLHVKKCILFKGRKI